ncbi:hypothetical protein BTM25_06090 [Actinomadura rubteroloni]|uniref:Uncharacterized protein n=1 Tax=Actinomadura rubteroloni TaxID=1926885 RepID=A0A2P4UMI9_9ACTN|nr:hypothetical protein [Actinomadura rubteroloni]POM26219.1 hypothetical protein BTM25_06090 [Actinomadura rubteroloni]
MLSALRKAGLSSQMMYTAGFGSIGVSVVSWMVSRTRQDVNRADHWGLFVGQWAPTFFALGAALRLEEQWGDEAPYRKSSEAAEQLRENMPVG